MAALWARAEQNSDANSQRKLFLITFPTLLCLINLSNPFTYFVSRVAVGGNSAE